MENVEHLPFSLNEKYLISADGRVFSLHFNRYLRPMLRGEYQSVEIRCNGKRKGFSIHRLVAETFLSKLDGCNIVNHKDGNKLNNHRDNLEWVTASENAQHAVDTGLIKHDSLTRGVYQLDLNTGEIINTFSSITEASKAVGLYSASYISSVCKGRKGSSGGYGWKYVNESIDISDSAMWQSVKDSTIWRSIRQFREYFVSIKGDIVSTKSRRLLKQHLTHTGYLRVYVSNDKISKTVLIHRLIAEVFIPNPNNYKIVDHINEIKTDNRVENLRWCTYQQNSNFVYENGRGTNKPVLQYDKNLNLITKYRSSSEGERKTGVSSSNISSVCRGLTKTAGGIYLAL